MKHIAVLILLIASASAHPSHMRDCDSTGGLAVDPNCLEPETDDGYKVLFRGVTPSLAEKDQKAIYSALASGLADGGESLVDLECVDNRLRYAKATGAQYPPSTSNCRATYSTTTADLNGDGIPEVFITGGSSYKSGRWGWPSVWLFAKDSRGHYVPHFGFPAANYRILTTKNRGFPDVEFSGLSCAIWRWDGKAYNHHKTVRKGGCRDAP